MELFKAMKISKCFILLILVFQMVFSFVNASENFLRFIITYPAEIVDSSIRFVILDSSDYGIATFGIYSKYGEKKLKDTSKLLNLDIILQRASLSSAINDTIKSKIIYLKNLHYIYSDSLKVQIKSIIWLNRTSEINAGIYEFNQYKKFCIEKDTNIIFLNYELKDGIKVEFKNGDY